MIEKQRTLKLLAQRLRDQLRRSVPQDILYYMTDAELVQEWHRFEEQRCKAAQKTVNKEFKNIYNLCLTKA